MAISPWYKGDTQPSWVISLTPDSGVFNVADLLTSNFTLLIRNTDIPGASDVTGTGAFSNLTPANGAASPASITYTPSTTDTGTLGNYVLFVVVTFPGGAIETFGIGTWQVIPK